MQLGAHFAFEGGIDRLVLPHPVHASEAAANDPRRIMVAVAGEVADFDPRIGYRRDNHRLDVLRAHGHQLFCSMICRRASTILWPSASRIWVSSVSTPADVRSP